VKKTLRIEDCELRIQNGGGAVSSNNPQSSIRNPQLWEVIHAD
jgi:hypothetical protein